MTSPDDSVSAATSPRPGPRPWERLRTWGEMIKFSHSIFALPFAVMAAFLAGTHIADTGRPDVLQLVMIVVCMVAARSVAMTFNRIADASIDARNPRTASRAIPTGRLSFAAAYAFMTLAMITFGVGCFGFHRFYGNAWPMLLSGPVLLYLCGYSYAKRFTRWSHLYLGSAIAFSPVATWLAIHPGSIGWTALALMGAVLFWIAGFDIIYSCQDIEVDRRDGLFSLPSRVGPAKALFTARVFHILTAVLLAAVGWLAGLGWIYLAGVAITAVLLAIENSLVKPDNFSRVNLAFFTVNGLVSVVLCVLTLIDILTGQPSAF